MDIGLIEYQMTTLTVILFLLSWYTQEVAYALVWYLLKLLEILIIVGQWLIIAPFPSGHVDTWGSPFALPSFFLTELTVVIIYIIVFHIWWHRPSWKPSFTTIFYTFLLILLGGYWLFLVPFYWPHVLLSILFGVIYGVLSAFFVKYIFVALWIDTLLDHFQDTRWTMLFGSKNTLMFERNNAWKNL